MQDSLRDAGTIPGPKTSVGLLVPSATILKVQARSSVAVYLWKVPPETTHLVHFMFLKLLQLPLEAQVGVGTGPPRTNCVQGVFPAKVGHSHDVCDHQCHTPGDPSQAARPRQPRVSRAV